MRTQRRSLSVAAAFVLPRWSHHLVLTAPSTTLDGVSVALNVPEMAVLSFSVEKPMPAYGRVTFSEPR